MSDHLWSIEDRVATVPLARIRDHHPRSTVGAETARCYPTLNGFNLHGHRVGPEIP